MSRWPVHPAAAVWPMLPEEELRALADDIKANGLRQSLVLTPSGELLAGRNREKACDLVGIEPSTTVYDGDPFAFVLSENKTRGHWSVPQRAMATALVLHQQGKRRDGRWQRGSVPADTRDSTSRRWADVMAQAGAVLDEVPELAPAVVAGTTALDVAYGQATERRKAKTDAAFKLAEGFGRAVHLLAAFADAEEAVTDFVQSYPSTALPVCVDDLQRAAMALAAIEKEWPDDPG